MGLPRDDAVTRTAVRVLKRFGVDEPPVDVDRICAGAGVQVFSRPFDYVAGVLLKDDVWPVIVVNAREGRERRRFTIAHELGHLFLGHARAAFAEPGGAGKLEREAEWFAAQLLMPAPWIQRYWDDYAANAENRETILAATFNVSLAALHRRAKEMGLDVRRPKGR